MFVALTHSGAKRRARARSRLRERPGTADIPGLRVERVPAASVVRHPVSGGQRLAQSFLRNSRRRSTRPNGASPVRTASEIGARTRPDDAPHHPNDLTPEERVPRCCSPTAGRTQRRERESRRGASTAPGGDREPRRTLRGAWPERLRALTREPSSARSSRRAAEAASSAMARPGCESLSTVLIRFPVMSDHSLTPKMAELLDTHSPAPPTLPPFHSLGSPRRSARGL